MSGQVRFGCAGLLLAAHGLACCAQVTQIESALFETIACRLDSTDTWSSGSFPDSRDTGFVRATSGAGMALGKECQGRIPETSHGP